MPSSKNQKIIALQTDHLSTLKTGSDSSLFIAAELAKRNYLTFFYSPNSLLLIDDKLVARGEFADVNYSNYQSSFNITGKERINLAEVSAILIRQDPPFNMDYITNTYLLEKLEGIVSIINSPCGIRNNSEKMSCFKFAHLMPSSIIVKEVTEEVIEFINTHSQVVIKPLYWFGGKNIKKISSSNKDLAIKLINESIEQFGHVMIQKFLPQVYEGDKRIIIIDVKAEGVLKRIPQNGNFIANLAAGGLGATTEITTEEYRILNEICPYLKREGIIFAGIDIIGHNLIEINVTSPTGLVAINKLYNLNLACKIANYIESLDNQIKQLSA